MVNKAKSTQGRKVEVSTSGGTTGSWIKIDQTSDIPLQTGSAQYLDATNYDSNEKEYISALDDVQGLNIPFQRVVGGVPFVVEGRDGGG